MMPTAREGKHSGPRATAPGLIASMTPGGKRLEISSVAEKRMGVWVAMQCASKSSFESVATTKLDSALVAPVPKPYRATARDFPGTTNRTIA